ncbi:MAG: selenocysteine-specific translation elongation factor [Acidobacteria bacterium]|nr:selenocysteine-specific translation elongation factor [Acidobacteriota bacterium]
MTVIATAGHVDHGKTSLVLALTGVDTDRLEEEKRRGVTIDLGFAHIDDLSFIDVPGHVKFLRNMLAGVGGIDASLFVIDAREGWMPQSEEHFEILRVLGVPRGVVAITKCDLVESESVDEVETLVRHRVAGSFLDGAPIIRTSIHDDTSIAVLREAVASLPSRSSGGGSRARLWIDRTFAAAGAGTIVTGTLLDAPLKKGDEVELVPGGRRAKVRGLQSRGLDVEVGRPGSRLAVNLTGVAHGDIERGHQVVHPDQWWYAATFDAELRVLPGLRHPLSRRGHFILYVGTEELPVTIRLIRTEEIAPGESGTARVFLPRALALAPHDRFILRETGRDETVAGGIVLEVDPASRISRAEPTADVADLIDRRGVVGTREVFLRTGEIHEPTVDDVIFSAARLSAAHGELVDLVRGSGDKGVEVSGLSEALRHAARMLRPESAVIENGRLYAPDRAPSTQVRSPLLDAFESSLFTPPDAGAFNRDELRRLTQAGRLVNLDGIHFSISAIDAAHAVARRLLATKPDGFSASEFREALGTSRKYAIPLIEALDARGVTRRRGDVRIAGPRIG